MKKFSFEDLEQILQELPVNIKQQKLSILIPFYNEQDCIVKNVYLVADTLIKWNWNFEIIASDDGSTDKSLERLSMECSSIKQLKIVKTTRNYGKGRALATAYEVSEGDYILFLDSDLELSVNHIPYFFKELIEKNADIIIGSKEDSRSNLEYPFIRKLFSRVYAFIIKILFNLPLKDTQTGIKLFRRVALENTLPYLLVKRFAFDIELLALCNYFNYKIITHPIMLQFTRVSVQGHMTLDTILHMLKDTLASFWRLKMQFWNKINRFDKNSYKYAVITFESQSKAYVGDIFQITTMEELSNLLPKLSNYDIIIFLKKGDELPEFIVSALDRVFADDTIQGIYPLIYSQVLNGKHFLYYSLLTNMFYNIGYYAHYRPIRQNRMKPHKKNIRIPYEDMIFRRKYLEELIKNDTDFRIKEFTNIIHSPYIFIHRLIPIERKQWNEYIKEEKDLSFQIKRQISNLYLMISLLGILGILLGLWFLILPWIILELGIHIWYILSLGIRLGVRYLCLFNKFRILNILNKFKKDR